MELLNFLSKGLSSSMMSSPVKLSYDTHPVRTDRHTHLHNYWIPSQIIKITSLCTDLESESGLWRDEKIRWRSRKVVGERVSRQRFDCCETEGAGAHPRETGGCGWERRREGNCERWTERKDWEWGREGAQREDSAGRKNTPCPPFHPPPNHPPTVKSNSLTHSEVVSLSRRRVTITKETPAARRGASGLFGWAIFPRRHNPLLANHCLDNDCAELAETYAGCWMMTHRLVRAQYCIWASSNASWHGNYLGVMSLHSLGCNFHQPCAFGLLWWGWFDRYTWSLKKKYKIVH